MFMAVRLRPEGAAGQSERGQLPAYSGKCDGQNHLFGRSLLQTATALSDLLQNATVAREAGRIAE